MMGPCHGLKLSFLWALSEREAEILKPLSSVEVVEKEEANFDTEISEDDIVGEWKLKGQLLARSPVRNSVVSSKCPRHACGGAAGGADVPSRRKVHRCMMSL